MAGACAVTKIENDDKGTLTVYTAGCFSCQGPGKLLFIDPEQFAAWDYGRGALIGVAFPTLSASERELLMTGTHAECWDKMFPPDEEDDE